MNMRIIFTSTVLATLQMFPLSPSYSKIILTSCLPANLEIPTISNVGILRKHGHNLFYSMLVDPLLKCFNQIYKIDRINVHCQRYPAYPRSVPAILKQLPHLRIYCNSNGFVRMLNRARYPVRPYKVFFWACANTLGSIP